MDIFSQSLLLLLFFCFVMMAISFFMAAKCYGVNIINFTLWILFPAKHTTAEGKKWAKRYWLCLITIFIIFFLLAFIEGFEPPSTRSWGQVFGL